MSNRLSVWQLVAGMGLCAAALLVSAGCPTEEQPEARPTLKSPAQEVAAAPIAKPQADIASPDETQARTETTETPQASPLEHATTAPPHESGTTAAVHEAEAHQNGTAEPVAEHGGGPESPAAHGDKPPQAPADRKVPIFVNWPTPRVALLISGEMIGYIEPCGCAGPGIQKGGLSRRHTLMEQLRQDGWPLVAVDLGGQIRRSGPQAAIKFARTANALVQLGYQAVGFGRQDLQLPADQLVSVAVNMAPEANPFVSANVGLFDFESGFSKRYRVVEAGGMRIGITSILGQGYQKDVRGNDVKLLAPDEALREILPAMKEEADFLVLLSHASPEETIELAKAFPDFAVVVTAGRAEEPPKDPATIPGTKTLLIEVGHKGMYVPVLGLYDDADKPIRYQCVPLDARFKDSNAMREMLAEYQDELRAFGLAGLGLKPQPHPTGREFVGSETCGDCHTKAYAVWKETPHAHATDTLVNLNPPRHYDPECLSCHVTGWDPQGYFPFESGYLNLNETKHLANNGCENCHGPGSMHVGVELEEIDATDAEREEYRKQMRLRLIEGEAEGKKMGEVAWSCVECHDPDNSPGFKFPERWEHVKHYGKN